MNGGLSNEIDRLQREIDQVNLLSSPAEFAQVISRDDAEPWFPYRHLVLINDRLVDLAEGRITRLMITLPPRHGKSLLCSLYLPAWYLNRYPDRRIILTSYGDDFAAEWGRKVRDLVQNHTEKLRIKINDQSKAADRWDVDGTAGGMKTAGVGGQITGRGANLFIIDDPVKSAEDAASATIRDKAWEWWQRTASTRLQPITRGGKRIQDPSLLVIQCMTGDTPVLMSTGTEKPLRDIRPGASVATFTDDGSVTTSRVVNWANQGTDDIFALSLASGRTVRANKRHPFWVVDESGEGSWVRLESLRAGMRVRRLVEPTRESSALIQSAINQPRPRAGVCPTTTRPDGPKGFDRPQTMRSQRGPFGFDSAMGSPSRSISEFWKNRRAGVPSAGDSRRRSISLSTGAMSSALITATTRESFGVFSATTATSSLPVPILPTSCNEPLSTWVVSTDEIISIESVGREEVFDIEVEHTHRFIANGLDSSNTRWHEDDLAGRFLLEDREHEWTVINLPALAEEDDLLGRTPGTALCPEIFNENALAAQRAIMGNAGFAALYQQRPQPEGGGAFKRADFRYWSTSPAMEKTYTLNDPDGSLLVPQQDCWRFITMDLALTAKTTSDWTVAAVWDVAPWLEPSRLILVHLERHRLEGAEHLDLVKKLWTAWRPNFIGIEEAMQGSMTLAASQRAGVLVRPLKHRSKDKAFRAKDAQLMLENHRVYFPRKASWLPDFEHELLLFPSGAHDDQVDCLIAGTLVETADGPRRIETISEGDRVWTRNGIRRVRAAGLSHASAEIFHVLMSDGEVLSGTRRHPVWVDGKGFVLLGELMEGDTLYRWQKSSCSMESGSVVIPTPPTPTTVATSPPDQPTEHAGSKTSIAKSGNLFMGRSRLKDKSTTLTAIGSTTIPRTWSVSRRKSMGSSTQTLNGLPSILSTWRVSDLSQPCGIAPKRDGKHTARQAVNIGLLAKQQNDPHAFGVGTRSSAAPTPKRSTARIVALPLCVGSQGSMTKHESASNAKPSSDATVTPKPSPVGPVVLAVIPGGNAAAYNLSVEGTPEYFANGVLVHNCFAYAAHELLRGVNMAKKPKVEETDTLEDKIWKQLRGRRTHDHPVLGRIR